MIVRRLLPALALALLLAAPARAVLPDEMLADPALDRPRFCREILCELAYPDYAANWETAVADASMPNGTRLALAALDPRNVTLEPEYYAECDDAKFQRVKPLLWLWYSFDRLPIGGQNVDLGVRLRRLLAPHIFKRCGERFKAFQHVEFSFGYNIECGDDVVVHRHVLLDDRDERPGVMFADMELTGIPHRVVIGDRGLKQNQLEYQGRRDKAAQPVALDNAAEEIKKRVCGG